MMKFQITHLVILSVLLLQACGGETDQTASGVDSTNTEEASEDKENSEDENVLRRYAMKSGIIEYEASGLQNGKETVYFDDWGLKEVKYSNLELKMGGISQKTNQIGYIDGEWNYNYNVDQKSGTKFKNPFFEPLLKNAKEKDLAELGKKMMEAMGGEMIGQEEVLGKTCDVWEVKNMKTKTWVWKNIPLKTESSLMNKLTIQATKIEENASIPADKFKLPEGVEFQDMSGILENGIPGKK